MLGLHRTFHLPGPRRFLYRKTIQRLWHRPAPTCAGGREIREQSVHSLFYFLSSLDHFHVQSEVRSLPVWKMHTLF